MNEDLQARLAPLVRRVSGKPSEPDPDESLFDSGFLDSFTLADLVAEIESEFSVKIPDADLNPRRFDSVARIAEYLEAREPDGGARWRRSSRSAIIFPNEFSITRISPVCSVAMRTGSSKPAVLNSAASPSPVNRLRISPRALPGIVSAARSSTRRESAS
jgi:acyl carrier protein